MAKKSKKDRIRLPKRILGAKVPKDARKRINRVLKMAPAGQSKPIVAGAVAMIATLLAERLEGPLNDMLKRYHLGEAKGRKTPTHSSPAVQH